MAHLRLWLAGLVGRPQPPLLTVTSSAFSRAQLRAVPGRGGPKHLIIRLRNWVGDVVLSLPALQALDEAGYTLTLVARGRWAPDLFRGTHWRVWVQPPGLWARAGQLRTLRHALSAEDPGFDHRLNTLLLPQSFSSALEARLAGLRPLGYAHEGRSLLLKHSVRMPSEGHVAAHYLALSLRLRSLLAPHLPPTAPLANPEAALPVAHDAPAAVQALLRARQVGARYIVVCPFAGGKSPTGRLDKSWPHFPAFVELAQSLNLPLLICPGPGEVELARDSYPGAICIEDCRLDMYAALLQNAALVVAIDTGPGHIAAAVGAPLLSLIGPSIAAHWKPLGPRVEMVPGYPEWPTPQRVLERCKALLA